MYCVRLGRLRRKGLFSREFFSTSQIWDCLLCISFSFDKPQHPPPLWQVSRYLSHLAGYYHSFAPLHQEWQRHIVRGILSLFLRARTSNLTLHCRRQRGFQAKKMTLPRNASAYWLQSTLTIWQLYAFFKFKNCFVVKKYIFLKTVLGYRQVLSLLKKNSNCME